MFTRIMGIVHVNKLNITLSSCFIMVNTRRRSVKIQENSEKIQEITRKACQIYIKSMEK